MRPAALQGCDVRAPICARKGCFVPNRCRESGGGGAIARLHRNGYGSGWPTYEAAEAELLVAIEVGRSEVCEEHRLTHLEKGWRPLLGGLAVGGLYTRPDAERIAVELAS